MRRSATSYGRPCSSTASRYLAQAATAVTATEMSPPAASWSRTTGSTNFGMRSAPSVQLRARVSPMFGLANRPTSVRR